jgi:transketolase
MKAMRDVWGDTLVSLGGTNPDVLVLDADLANSTKADKFAKMYPERFLQMGIAEQNFIGVAVGLASVGFIPWLSTFTVFFTHRAADPIRMLGAQTHANIKIGAAYSGILTGLTGKTHQDVQDLAIMRAMPDMIVLAPVDSIEREAAIRWATDHNGPVYLRLARDVCPDVSEADYEFVLGRTIPLRQGDDVSPRLHRASKLSMQGSRGCPSQRGNLSGCSSRSVDQAG